ncbi:fimbrial protein [Escherichia marmotae]|nr:fimbrial protein [Escherichia marmotae]
MRQKNSYVIHLQAFALLLAAGAVSEVIAAAVQKTVFTADVVASACHVVVDADSSGNSGRLTFGTYRKSTGTPVPSRDFTVRLYESGSTVQGCSAFLAGQIATLDFGNPGQLDAAGVVTRGAGDGIRVDVRAVDAQADYRDRLTQANHSVNYPVEFAARGQFRFRAQPEFPATVKAGEYYGALTFVVTYQ